MNYPTLLLCKFMFKHSALQEIHIIVFSVGEENSGDPAQTCSPVVVTPECVDDTYLGMLSRFLVDVVIQLVPSVLTKYSDSLVYQPSHTSCRS